MNIHIDDSRFIFDKRLKEYLDSLITHDSCSKNGVIFNFRDKSYSSVTGGFHPVEIAVSGNGRVLYITDFAYYGVGEYAELCKELDFDFSQKIFQTVQGCFDITQGTALFKVWQENFICYSLDWKSFDEVTVRSIT